MHRALTEWVGRTYSIGWLSSLKLSPLLQGILILGKDSLNINITINSIIKNERQEERIQYIEIVCQSPHSVLLNISLWKSRVLKCRAPLLFGKTKPQEYLLLVNQFYWKRGSLCKFKELWGPFPIAHLKWIWRAINPQFTDERHPRQSTVHVQWDSNTSRILLQ